jgi:hypothetical protein
MVPSASGLTRNPERPSKWYWASESMICVMILK